MPSFDTSSDTNTDNGDTDATELPITRVDEAFKCAFLYRGRPGSDFLGRTDLFVMDSLNPKPVNVTGDRGWSCQDGCRLGPDFAILGVFLLSNKPDVPPDMNLYSLNKDMRPADSPIRTVKGIQNAHFGKNVLYFTRKGSCPKDPAIANTYCMYSLSLPLDKNTREKQIFTFPGTTQDAKNSQYNGSFRVAPDGKAILLLNPTYSSQEVFIWNNGKLRQMGQDICYVSNDKGQCLPTGSDFRYTDMDPMGMAPDGSVIITALVENDRDLRLRKFETDPAKPVTYSDFYSVAGSYTNLKCNKKLRQPWQYTDIDGDLHFTKDSKAVVFIASMPCDNAEKPWTDIVKIDVDRIGNGQPLTRDSIFQITRNPQVNASKATRIKDFTFSPSGKFIAFIGTPLLQTDGSPVSSTGTRHINDLEIYFISADGSSVPLQVTNSLDYMAVRLWVK